VFASCASKVSLEDKAKKYVTDSVLSSFNDPKSFEFVSSVVDTFRVVDEIKNVNDLLKYKQDSAKSYRELDSLAKIDKNKIINYQITITYRAKNAMGALMLDKMLLFYYPESNRFQVYRLQEK
jgi:hypothetical protein